MFHKNLPASGFEPRTSGINSDRSANWATTTATPLSTLLRSQVLNYFSLNVFYFAFYKSAFSSEIIIFKPKVYQKFSKAIKPFRENVCFLKKFKTTLLCRMVFGHHLDTNYCILMAYVWILFYFWLACIVLNLISAEQSAVPGAPFC